MSKRMTRRPSRAAVLRSLAELATLWRPPDKDTAEPEGIPGSAAEESADTSKPTPRRSKPQRRAT